MPIISDEGFQQFMDEIVKCVLCNESLDGEGDVVTLKEKGSEGVNRASAERVDTITTVPG